MLLPDLENAKVGGMYYSWLYVEMQSAAAAAAVQRQYGLIDLTR